jgi:hypothetical protein
MKLTGHHDHVVLTSGVKPDIARNGRILISMTRRPLDLLIRNVEAPVLLESFFIAAVASFLGIRAFLALAGYPKIGSNGIHIAHMLWGGLLMLAALLLLLAFLDRSVQHVAAVVAGLGFGTFIDEIGKFVTADNDYFYRPAVALIYGLFVVAFLAARTFVGQRPMSPREALANALDLLARATGRPIESDDRTRIRLLLERADPEASGTVLAQRYLDALPAVPAHDSPIEAIDRRLGDRYAALMRNPWAERALVIGVLAYTVLAVAGVLVLAIADTRPGEPSAVATTADLVSTLAGAVLVARGIVSLRDSRLAAYHWFMRGVLVWILVTQVFVFYSSQLAGLGGLAFDLAAYGSLRFALTRELVGP